MSCKTGKTMDITLTLQQEFKEKLKYLYDNMSEREVSRRTGIKRATLYDWKKGGRITKFDRYGATTGVFKNLAIEHLERAGMPKAKAEHYAQRSPDEVKEKMAIVQGIVDRLAKEQSTTIWKSELKAGRELSLDRLYQERYDKILVGMRASTKGMKEWERY